MNNLEVKIYTPQELNHSSYIQTGLFELEHDDFLKTQVVLSFKKRLGTIKVFESGVEETNQPHPKTSFYLLNDKRNEREISFATDLYDASFSFSKHALENCDYIFKRNYEQRIIEKLPLAYQRKILPLGLTFGTHSEFKNGNSRLFWGLLISNLIVYTKYDRLFFKRLFNCFREQISHWKFIKTTRLIKDFEKVNQFSDDTILFQTRCFPHEEGEDVKKIHQQRYDLVLLLREKFGEKFKGGIIPSPIAIQNYSGALSNLPSDPVSYLKTVKNSKIVIYTRGLANSPAWKMAEYLSQGKVIIAEKLSAGLAYPLIDGKEVLFFENHHDLIDKINLVLINENLSSALSQNARKYFEEIVHPKQNIKRIINLMLQHKTIE